MSIFRRIEPMLDRGAALIFDWIREVPGETTKDHYELFSFPLGQIDWSGKHKTAADTNMYVSQRLMPPSGFLVGSLHCFYGTMETDEREAFRENYSLEFHISHKIFYRSPLVAIPYEGVILPCGCTPEAIPGLKQPGDMRQYPRYITSLEQFKIRLYGRPIELAHGLRFCPVLNGALDSAVR